MPIAHRYSQPEEQQRVIGYDVFCANHRIGAMPSEHAQKSLRLFGEEVISAFR